MGNCGQGASALCPKYASLKAVAMVLFKSEPSVRAALNMCVGSLRDGRELLLPQSLQTWGPW